MAFLRASDNIFYLKILHIFGRNSSKSDTCLDNSDSSQIHASIRWNGRDWVVVDHSRNGTFLDGKRLSLGVPVALALNQKIRFGSGGGSIFEVENIDPPRPMLIPSNNIDQAIFLNDIHFFPNENEPKSSIFLTATGKWQWDDETGSKILHDGEVVQVLDKNWLCFLSITQDHTLDLNINLAVSHPIKFDFFVSQCEEHTYLYLNVNGRKIDLGERSHHYCLLTLARLRFDHFCRGFDELCQGWIGVEDLSKMLGIEPTHLNTQLFRIRTQIMREVRDCCHFQDVIERRRGEVRMCAAPFQILHGRKLEASFDLPSIESNFCL